MQERPARPFSPEEAIYLRNRNRIRLLEICGQWVWILFFACLIAGMLFLAWEMASGIWVPLILLSCVGFLAFVMWRSWGRGVGQLFRMRWWLGKAEAIEIDGEVRLRFHPTQEIDNLWTLDGVLIDVPPLKHYEAWVLHNGIETTTPMLAGHWKARNTASRRRQFGRAHLDLPRQIRLLQPS